MDTTIFNALERRASDIHIESRDQEVAIKYRIDGVLHYAMPPIAKDWHSTIISRIKVMSELDIAEKRVPQDGRFRVRYKNRLIDFRVSIMPTIHGEDAVLRVLDKESMSEKFAKLSLDVVGFSDADLVKFRRYIQEPYGMVLVTGPTGSGKTTTLYAALSEIKNDEDKIITIEDPVEYQIKGITQIPVNEKKGLTFARGLRSILRHDPDKIMVGEIRDQETAQIAINSALTGHLVFTTVHANNVLDVLGRFLNMGVEAVQLRFGAELHPGAAAGARDLRTLQAAGALSGFAADGERPEPGRVARRAVRGRRGLLRMRRHGIPRPHRDSRTAGPDRPHPRDDSGQAADLGNQARRPGRRHDVPARIGRARRCGQASRTLREINKVTFIEGMSLPRARQAQIHSSGPAARDGVRDLRGGHRRGAHRLAQAEAGVPAAEAGHAFGLAAARTTWWIRTSCPPAVRALAPPNGAASAATWR